MRRFCRAVVVAIGMLAGTATYAVCQGVPRTDPGLAIDAQVSLISAAEAARLMARQPVPLIVDVREPEEFGVAHLAGALRLAPDADVDRERTVAMLAKRAKGRAIVFYCTTLGRSQRLAEALHQDLLEAGIARVVVVKGGIIAWANAGLALVDRRGRRTKLVHTHDAETAKSLRNQARARF